MLERLKPFRRVALVSGIGAAGLIAYRMYAAYGTGESTWRTWWIPQSCSFLPSSWLQYFAAMRLVDPASGNCREQAQQAESDRLSRHFEMTVNAGDEYHSELLESVVAKLFQVDGLEEILRMAQENAKAQESKSDLIKAASFTRFIVALWTVPTSFLLCRLMFCIFGRIVYLSIAAENIHKSRRQMYLEAEQCPPLFGITYQRRLLRTFKSIVPDTISRVLYRLISQVVSKHVENIKCDAYMSLIEMNQLLSTINSEIENKITAQDNGEFWKSLLGDSTLLASLGLGTRDDDANEQSAYIEDVLREARHMVTLRSWHLVVVDTVKVFVQKQTVFLNEAYATVLDEMMHPPCKREEEDLSSDDSYDEEGTDIFETGSSAFNGVREEEGTVIYDDEVDSESSDKSIYDVDHTSEMYYMPSREQRLSPELRMSPQERSRHVAESSLEPLECSDADGFVPQFESLSVTFSDGYDKKGHYDLTNDSEVDTGEHHSLDHGFSPRRKRSPRKAAPASRSKPAVGKTQPTEPQIPDGILFFRWATKLGRRGKDILNESAITAQELSSLSIVHDFCLNVFAPDSVTSLPRCQLESAPLLHRRR